MSSHNRVVRVIVAVSLLAWSSGTLAYGPAKDMVKDCKATPVEAEDALQQIQCLGYVSGFLDAYELASGLHPEAREYCAPKAGISLDAALDALVEYLRAHPDAVTVPSRTALLLALKQRYPCGARRK